MHRRRRASTNHRPSSTEIPDPNRFAQTTNEPLDNDFDTLDPCTIATDSGVRLDLSSIVSLAAGRWHD